MNASRFGVALLALAMFVAGIATGVFVSGTPAPVQPATGLSEKREPTVAQTLPGEVSHVAAKEDQVASEPASEEVVSRLLSTFAINDENARHAEWLRLLPSLTSADAAQVRELFRKMKAQGRRFDFEWETFWPRWGELDPLAALEHVRANETAETQGPVTEMVLRGWAKADSASARAWLSANPSASTFGPALRGYLDGLARIDLARATHDAQALGQGRDIGEFVDVLAEQALQQRQLTGMLEWWRTLPDDPNQGSVRMAAVAPVFSRLADADLAQAQGWLTELAGSPYREEGSIGNFAQRLAATDPAAAVGWMASLPPTSDGHYTAIGRTVRAWSAADQPGLDRWIATLPPSPLREQAVEAQQQRQAVFTYDVTRSNGEMNSVIRFSQPGQDSQIQTLRARDAEITIIQRP